MTTRWRSQTLAAGTNSRLNTPMVPGPQTSWVINTSAFTQTLSPAATVALPEARARSFSVSVIIQGPQTSPPQKRLQQKDSRHESLAPYRGGAGILSRERPCHPREQAVFPQPVQQ